MPATNTQQMNPAQVNMMARQLVVQNSVDMLQSVFSQTYNNTAGGNITNTVPSVTVQPSYVGLLKGFFVKVSATITNGSAEVLNLADFGPANILSQIQLVDLANVTRINTTGWHLNIINTAKGGRVFGTSAVRTTGFDSPINYGSNWLQEISAPATIAAGANGLITMWYWIPAAYSAEDLRGAIYLNVVNATMRLILNFNPQPVAANGTDSTQSLYVAAAAGSVAAAVISQATVTVYQSYYDQLPAGQNGVILPLQDLAYNYELKNTAIGNAPLAGQDYPIQYANFRRFLSTTVIYVNTGATGARGVGADLNYLGLQASNLTYQFKIEPSLAALLTRRAIGVDTPPGVYYFDSRNKPINTVQYGNMQLVLNPAVANAGAYVLMGYEDMALLNQVSTAGSLPAA